MSRLSEKTIEKGILLLLKQHPEGPTITDLSKMLKLHRATVTKYIMFLVGLGIVKRRRVGAVTLHYLKEEFVQKVGKEEMDKKLGEVL
ncbi:MarR family transcriptional regulator [archaeon]|nr:MarR family transcriptional regulator [archaeon]